MSNGYRRLFLSRWSLGVRQVLLLALSAYFALAVSTVSLQKTILEAAMCPENEVFTAYMSKWCPFQALSNRQTLS